jgi:hypothetical protein
MIGFASLLTISSSFGLWAMTIICLRGCDWILISGYSLLPKEDKDKYRQKYDVISMNKYLGKTVFMPLAAICSITSLQILFEPAWMNSGWYTTVLIVAVFVTVGRCFYAVVQVLGDRFKK